MRKFPPFVCLLAGVAATALAHRPAHAEQPAHAEPGGTRAGEARAVGARPRGDARLVGTWRSAQSTGHACDFEFRADGTLRAALFGAEPFPYAVADRTLSITVTEGAGQRRGVGDVISFELARPDPDTIVLWAGKESGRPPGGKAVRRTFKDTTLVRCVPSARDAGPDTRPVLALPEPLLKPDGTLAITAASDPLYGLGPAGLTVFDLIQGAYQGVGPEVLRAMVLGRRGPYKLFDVAEALKLHEAGLTDSVVAAMIQVTADAQRSGEPEALARAQAENAQLRERVRELEGQGPPEAGGKP